MEIKPLSEEQALQKVEEIRADGGDAIAVPPEDMTGEGPFLGWQVIITELPFS